MPKEEFRFHTTLRVRWNEVDAQGIVYYGAYMDYLEAAQAAYYRNLGFSLYKLAQIGYFDTATVKVTLEYKAPARVEDLLDVYYRVASIDNTSIAADLEIYSHDQLLTTGQAVYVGYDASSGETRPVPQDIRRLVESYEKDGVVLPLDQYPNLAGAVLDD